MARFFNKSGKQAKKIRTKTGMRTYWVRAAPKQKRAAGRPQAPQKPGFLRRNAGKIALGTALVGAALLNRHKLMGAARGISLAHNVQKHSGEKLSISERARGMMMGAKAGYLSNRGMDRIDHHADRFKAGVHARAQRAHEWRKTVGSDLAGHLTEQGGGAVASHVGSRFGQVAGSAIGSVAGPAGALVGGFLGGHAGEFLAHRHGGRHIRKAAAYAAHRVRGGKHSEFSYSGE